MRQTSGTFHCLFVSGISVEINLYGIKSKIKLVKIEMVFCFEHCFDLHTVIRAVFVTEFLFLFVLRFLRPSTTLEQIIGLRNLQEQIQKMYKFLISRDK